MDKIIIYACYGMLGNEKATVWSSRPSECCDKYSATLPDGWAVCTLVGGAQGLQDPFGGVTDLAHALISRGGAPYLLALEPTGYDYKQHCYKLAAE